MIPSALSLCSRSCTDIISKRLVCTRTSFFPNLPNFSLIFQLALCSRALEKTMASARCMQATLVGIVDNRAQYEAVRFAPAVPVLKSSHRHKVICKHKTKFMKRSNAYMYICICINIYIYTYIHIYIYIYMYI